MNAEEIKTKLTSLGLEKFINKREINYIAEFLNEDDKILYAFYTNEIAKKDKVETWQPWLTVLTNNKIIMLDKGFLSGLKSKVILFDKISLCEKQDNDITISLSNSTIKLKISNIVENTILSNAINAFLNKQDIEKAVQNVIDNPPKKSKASLILFGIIALIILFMVKSCFFDGDDDKTTTTQPTKSTVPIQEGIMPNDNYNVACYTKDDYNEIFKASAQGDNQHFKNMIINGRCHLLKDFAGKKYFVVDLGIMKSKIRVYISDYESIELYTPSDGLPMK